MARVFIGIGSNIGDRLESLKKASNKIDHLLQTKIVNISSIYETEPVGNKQQPKFLNAVLELDTNISPWNFMAELKKIEIEVGRTRNEHWGPREIDLDILYFGDEIINDIELHIPHPEIANRRFVLIPLNEIARDFFDPLRHKSIEVLLHHCQDTGGVRKTTFCIKSESQE